LGVLSEEHAYEKRGIEVLPPSLVDESVSNAKGQRAVVGVLVQDRTDAKSLLGRR
jgi:hypothetical protein